MSHDERDEWWLDCSAIAALYQWLCDEGRLDPNDVKEVRYMISKPWKWSLEWREMTGASPDSGVVHTADEDLAPLLEASIVIAKKDRGRR